MIPLLVYPIIAVPPFQNCSDKKVSEVRKPNIVLINVDDLGRKNLGFMKSLCYGTPNLDSFVEKRMVFKNAYAAIIYVMDLNFGNLGCIGLDRKYLGQLHH